MKIAISFLMIAFCATTIASAQSSPKLAIDVVPAFQVDAPIQIVAMQKSLENQLKSIDVKNTSNRKIIRMQFAWVSGVPSQCAPAAVRPQSQLLPPVHADLEPGESTKLNSLFLDSGALKKILTKEKATLLHVQLGAMSVDFADGSTWRSASTANELFNPEWLERRNTLCSNGHLRSEVAGNPCSAGANQRAALQSPLGLATPNIVGCYYKCEGSDLPQRCAVSGQNACGMTACNDRNLCPYQACLLVCI